MEYMDLLTIKQQDEQTNKINKARLIKKGWCLNIANHISCARQYYMMMMIVIGSSHMGGQVCVGIITMLSFTRQLPLSLFI